MSEEIVIHEGEIIPRLEVKPMSLFGDKAPAEVISEATEVANALMQVVKEKRLAKTISGRDYLVVEAWTLLGSMLGVFPVCVWSRPLDGGWEARVEARTLAGAIVGAAEAQCMYDERNWHNRDDYALRSMAQTRATAKALRLPLGFIAILAGFEATPADEIPDQPEGERPKSKRIKRAGPEAIAELESALKALSYSDKWTTENVLRGATKKFGREITKLTELSEEEVREILDGAQEFYYRNPPPEVVQDVPQVDMSDFEPPAKTEEV